MSIKLSRRSPRLLEKEACDNITRILEDAGVPLCWVFDDALFKRRWEYEELCVRQEGSMSRGCHCHECNEAAYAEREEYNDLPSSYFPEEQLWPVIDGFHHLAHFCERPEQKLIYITAFMRFIHGPGRFALKFDKLRADIKAECSAFPEAAMDAGLILTEFGERMSDACWAVAALIAEHEDEDGYNIFML